MSFSSRAALLDAPVPENAYITFNGMQWAWANAVAGDGSFNDVVVRPGSYTGIDLGYQSQFGWRLGTAAELASGPQASDFLFEGANVPGAAGSIDPVSGAFNTVGSRNGMDMACASPYFSAWARTCNFGNGPGLNLASSTPWWGMPGSFDYSDTLVVRQIPAVPEPSTWLLMALGLGAVTLRARRQA